MDNRIDLLNRLLDEPRSAREVRGSLLRLDWDSDEELVDLRREHLCRVFESFLGGALDATALEQWADAVEGRDDIGRENGFDSLLNDAIHFLANPDTEGSLTAAKAEEWLHRLRV